MNSSSWPRKRPASASPGIPFLPPTAMVSSRPDRGSAASGRTLFGRQIEKRKGEEKADENHGDEGVDASHGEISRTGCSQLLLLHFKQLAGKFFLELLEQGELGAI